MDDRMSPVNPRLGILRREVDQTVLKPFRSHRWSAQIVREIDGHDCIEIAAERGAIATRIAVLYSSSGISKSDYGVLQQGPTHLLQWSAIYARVVCQRCHRSGGTARRLLPPSRRPEQAGGVLLSVEYRPPESCFLNRLQCRSASNSRAEQQRRLDADRCGKAVIFFDSEGLDVAAEQQFEIRQFEQCGCPRADRPS